MKYKNVLTKIFLMLVISVCFSGRVISPRQHESMVKLLTIFAQHLAMVSNQVLIRQQNAELPVTSPARNARPRPCRRNPNPGAHPQ